MFGRTPEYVDKKIEAREINLAMLAILAVPRASLYLTASAMVSPAGVSGFGNAGPHRFSEVLHARTSAANTTASAFGGLPSDAGFYNLTLALAMVLARFCVVIPVLALVGSLADKRWVPVSAGTLPTTGSLTIKTFRSFLSSLSSGLLQKAGVDG